ncbi:unnamed protein product, partial [Mesorhabditis spiculigera]
MENEFLSKLAWYPECTKTLMSGWKLGTTWIGGMSTSNTTVTLDSWVDSSAVDYTNFADFALPNRYLLFKPYVFNFPTEGRRRSIANSACVGTGATLTSIRSAAENEFISRLAEPSNCSTTNFGWPIGSAWIGGLSNTQASVPTLASWTDGSGVDFSNLANGSIVDNRFALLKPYGCGAMAPGFWGLSDANQRLGQFICRTKAD